MEKGCSYIYQLLDDQGEFISFEWLQMRFGNDLLIIYAVLQSYQCNS